MSRASSAGRPLAQHITRSSASASTWAGRPKCLGEARCAAALGPKVWGSRLTNAAVCCEAAANMQTSQLMLQVALVTRAASGEAVPSDDGAPTACDPVLPLHEDVRAARWCAFFFSRCIGMAPRVRLLPIAIPPSRHHSPHVLLLACVGQARLRTLNVDVAFTWRRGRGSEMQGP